MAATHPNVLHVDDVPPTHVEAADIAYDRRRLAAAGGAVMIGASRYDIAPNARLMPPHTHSDEEEIFYVLSGSGVLWQGGKTYAVAAGDCIVHRIQSEPHTLLASGEGMTVFAFGEGSLTNITHLPRSDSWWIGSRWMPAGPNPFKLETELGPLELPSGGPEAERPANVVAFADVDVETEVRPGYDITERAMSRAAGAHRSGLRHDAFAPGTISCPPHWHTSEEELFVVLGGGGEVVLGDERFPVRAGSVVVRPPGTKVPHSFLAGPEGLTYLAYGTRVPADVCFYTRSGKANIGGVTFRLEATDYWEGEESAEV